MTPSAGDGPDATAIDRGFCDSLTEQQQQQVPHRLDSSLLLFLCKASRCTEDDSPLLPPYLPTYLPTYLVERVEM